MPPNRQDISSIFCEFLEIAVHNILYIKKIYPDSVFVPKRKYGVIVHQCIHPDVESYISNCLNAVYFHFEKNQLRSFQLIFQSGSMVIDKFVFDLLNTEKNESDPYFLDLEKHLRDFCLKLHTVNCYLDSLPDDATFSILLNTTEISNLEFNDNPMYESFPWVHCNIEDSLLEHPDIIPLQDFNTSSLNLQIYAEIQNASIENTSRSRSYPNHYKAFFLEAWLMCGLISNCFQYVNAYLYTADSLHCF